MNLHQMLHEGNDKTLLKFILCINDLTPELRNPRSKLLDDDETVDDLSQNLSTANHVGFYQ